MSFFSRLCPAYRKRSRLRAMIRGFSQLKREQRIGLERRVRSALIDARLEMPENISSLIFGTAIANAERSVHQYLFEQRVTTKLMNRAIVYALASKSAVVFALPKVWQDVLAVHGLNVDRGRSSRAWRWFLLMYFCRNVLRIGRMLLSILTTQSQPLSWERYAYFDGLSEGNLPHSVGRSYDI